jgi:hypothetical protein
MGLKSTRHQLKFLRDKYGRGLVRGCMVDSFDRPYVVELLGDPKLLDMYEAQRLKKKK